VVGRADPIDPEVLADDRSPSELDDEADRDELRRRYYGLLQELRVLLPGVQILVAFLLTVPFAKGFPEVDAEGRDLYGIALVSGVLSVVAFVTPTVFHRVAPRRSRVERLVWGIRLSRVGLLSLGISLISGLALVARFVFGGLTAVLISAGGVVVLVGIWVILPVFGGRPHGLADPPDFTA
jgi:hypothetical protein